MTSLLALRVLPLRARMSGALALVGLVIAGGSSPTAQSVLKVGVTLHPYYSWTKNVVGALPAYEVRSILPGEIDAGDYQPRPEDIKKLIDLDAIVVNGIGHDDFIFPMIKASGNTTRHGHPSKRGHAADSSGARDGRQLAHVHLVHQRHPADLRHSEGARRAAAARRRSAPAQRGGLRQAAAGHQVACGGPQLAEAKITRVVTVHDGYGYLMQEFGLEIAGVVQPAHGLTPSAAELRDMVRLLQREKIRSCSARRPSLRPLLKVLHDEAGVKVYTISHIASAPSRPTRSSVTCRRTSRR